LNENTLKIRKALNIDEKEMTGLSVKGKNTLFQGFDLVGDAVREA
jgi:hypothetical protein